MMQPSRTEFIALMAMLSAAVAFAIDAMLPALPQIAAELTPDAPNRAQLIVTSFVLGMGIGTLFTGPMSDAWGRKPVVIGGAVLYCTGALLAWAAPTLELMLAARLLQGLGAAGPRVVAVAIIRDRHEGTEMARIMSFVMLVFSLVPAIAPSLGAVIIWGAGWRGVFVAFVAFAVILSLWLWLRLPETLAPARRRALRPGLLWAAFTEVLAQRIARIAMLLQMLSFGMLFGVLSSTQGVFDITFGQGDSFPFWFMGISVLAASASLINARLVGRIGMRRMVRGMYGAQVMLSGVTIVVFWLGIPLEMAFWVYFIWTVSVFFQAGMTIGNLNALAMQPLGHIAGMAASVTAAVATVGGVAIAVPIGQVFDGTPLPIAIGVAMAALVAFLLSLRLGRG